MTIDYHFVHVISQDISVISLTDFYEAQSSIHINIKKKKIRNLSFSSDTKNLAVKINLTYWQTDTYNMYLETTRLIGINFVGNDALQSKHINEAISPSN